MAEEEKSAPNSELIALREEVELLELKVRRAQAQEWLRNHKMKRMSEKTETAGGDQGGR